MRQSRFLADFVSKYIQYTIVLSIFHYPLYIVPKCVIDLRSKAHERSGPHRVEPPDQCKIKGHYHVGYIELHRVWSV